MQERTKNFGSSAPTLSWEAMVTQVGHTKIWPIVPFMLLCVSPFVACLSLLDVDAPGLEGVVSSLASLVIIILATCVMFCSIFLWCWLGDRWDRWRGNTGFSGLTEIEINQKGFRVEGLGSFPWADILAIDRIPDSDSMLNVQILRYGLLLLQQIPAERVAEVFDHYMTVSQDHEGPPFFRAVPFRWWVFTIRIAMGYAAGLAAMIMLCIHDANLFLGALLMGPLVAVMVWGIPIGMASPLLSRRMCAYQFHANGWLRSTDGLWSADLATSKVHYRHRKGITYDLTFISIRPCCGRSLDLLIEPDAYVLLKQWAAMGLLANPDDLPSPPDQEAAPP